MALKAEAMGLATMLELPLLILDIQPGPSTGLPTKTEQADLLMAMHGRHGEAPLPIIAACPLPIVSTVCMKQCYFYRAHGACYFFK